MNIVASTFDWIVHSVDDNPKGMALVVLFAIVIIASRTISTTIGLGLCMQALAWLLTIGEPSTARSFYMIAFGVLFALHICGLIARNQTRQIEDGRGAYARTPSEEFRFQRTHTYTTRPHPLVEPRTRSEQIVNLARRSPHRSRQLSAAGGNRHA